MTCHPERREGSGRQIERRPGFFADAQNDMKDAQNDMKDAQNDMKEEWKYEEEQ